MSSINLGDLKEIEKKVLRNLIEDSNQSLSAIAEKTDTTRQNISLKIKKLKDRNIIKSFTITLNTNLINELSIKAIIFLREVPDSKLRGKNEKEISKMPQVTHFSRLYGRYSGLIEILVKDNEEANDIINKLHELEGIIETETYFVRQTIKDDVNSPILNLLK